MADHSFDVVSKVNLQEVLNAVQQTEKEVATRYDLKDSDSTIELKEADSKILLASSDDYKLNALYEILTQKLAKRNVSVKALQAGKVESASGGTVRQEIVIQKGLIQEHSKIVSKDIKDAKLKVQVNIQGDQIRVVGKNIDDLQTVIHMIKEKNYPFHLEYINYR
ncbi:MAG: YajQ family cyclic di-GMP-binding protein [Candidatus Margulisbacteria bacterium]|nr:YajQ family cyclic di-GMP-binding protein [Candidatus Margulisiibacteriota bacterium]